MKTLKDIDIRGKTVLLRADYNVPLVDDKVGDDYRITQSLPTLRYLLEQDCRVVIISHLGRPEGKEDARYSLSPIAGYLQEQLGEPVALAADFEQVDSAKNRITLLENLRFWPGEEANSEEFARQLSELGEVFVQDGFGVVHRSHASTEAITKFLPSVAGLLLEKEVTSITEAMENPKRPLVAILGGAKVSDKIELIDNFIGKADRILIGGAMANTFFDYEGLEIGQSNYESGQEAVITRLAQKALERQENVSGCDEVEDGKVCLKCVAILELPSDVAVAKSIDVQERRTVVDVANVKSDEYILDIGTSSIQRFQDIVAKAGTVVWNGPLGMTELTNFAHGSNFIAKTLRDNRDKITSIIGGGDTAGFIMDWDIDKGKSFSLISTGGGAALELMAGKKLPGIEALS